MKLALVFSIVLMLPPGFSDAEGPLATDADKYKLRIENDRVRVLEHHDKPGEKTNMHDHPDFVLCSMR